MNYFSTTFLVTFLIATLLFISPAYSSGFAASVQVDGRSISRIGQATARYAGLLKIYDAALYAPEAIESGQLLDPAIPKRLEIAYRVSVSSEQLIEAANTVLQRQNDPKTLHRWQASIDRLHKHYRNVEKGDRFALISDADGLTLNLNGETLARIEEVEFSRVYLAIWFGKNPLSDSLKKDLIP